MGKHELWELQSMQAAPLSTKISMTKQRIREWVNEYGECDRFEDYERLTKEQREQVRRLQL